MNGARGPALGLINGLAVLGNRDLSSWRGGGSGLRLDLVAGRGDTNGFMQGKAMEPIVQRRCYERLWGLAWCTSLPGWLTLSSMRAMEGLAPTLGLIPQRACIVHAWGDRHTAGASHVKRVRRKCTQNVQSFRVEGCGV